MALLSHQLGSTIRLFGATLGIDSFCLRAFGDKPGALGGMLAKLRLEATSFTSHCRLRLASHEDCVFSLPELHRGHQLACMKRLCRRQGFSRQPNAFTRYVLIAGQLLEIGRNSPDPKVEFVDLAGQRADSCRLLLRERLGTCVRSPPPQVG
ncbi:hypothetical protein [Brevundimonas sp.]|uniref:hypothetical protein n=1 Tax=Brevundimonas sp. TaxID=1871086 RepID=UPI003D1293B5